MGQGHEPRSLRPILTEHPSTGVYLARHGQTAYNKEGRFQGQQDIPLNNTGRAQALDLAERAAQHSFAVLWTSPLLRARETADAVAAKIGLEPIEDARLMETDAGDWTNRSFEEVHAEAPELFDAFASADADFAFPGGESFLQQEERVAAVLTEVEAGLLPALVVCHGMVIRAAFAARAADRTVKFERVGNAALVPLAPHAQPQPSVGGAPLNG
jgi:broad specificity phosphatase PhoE